MLVAGRVYLFPHFVDLNPHLVHPLQPRHGLGLHRCELGIWTLGSMPMGGSGVMNCGTWDVGGNVVVRGADWLELALGA